MKFLEGLTSLAAALSPAAQDGSSLWGGFLSPALPKWIVSGGLKSLTTPPWGEKTSGSDNPYTTAPFTEITRHYDFEISRGTIAPDGYEKSVILVNGQFPGPLIEANWGDEIEVTVHNHIQDEPEGTTIHWHGFLQTGTPWADGVPGVSQCPIAPGKSFTYKFRAELYGTSWYHSHYSAQYSGGLIGPIVVYGPSNADYDIDVGPIMVNDWLHKDYYAVVEEVMASGFHGRVYSDNNLINGRMNFDCSTLPPGNSAKCTDNAGLSKFQFQAGKTHRLRFINSGSDGVQRISIDNHMMTVIANDFVEIKPYETKVVTLGVGQRVDVIVKADGNPESAYWLRSTLTTCSSATQPMALAAIYYNGADTDSVPASKPWDVPDPGTCANDDLAITEPYYPMELPEPSWVMNMDIAMTRNASGVLLWTFGGISARVDYNNPSLYQANEENWEYGEGMNVMNFGSNSSVRFIVNNPTPSSHPMHAHGVNMYILSQGPGNYNHASPTRPENPMRRDVQMVQPFGHIVVQMDVLNPGIWPFHCHIAWHASAGFFSQMIFLPEEIGDLDIPHESERTCHDWEAFTRRFSPDQIDSGL
ncbi:multicopper oxidase-domain-containing protein [Xylaria sp. CBS 124048]|nr:multicopper oxidase-domain-containing protein [Xylaria sp. CBS 124048]